MDNLIPLIGLSLPENMLKLFMAHSENISLHLSGKEKNASGSFEILKETLPVRFKQDASNKTLVYHQVLDDPSGSQPAKAEKSAKDGHLWNKTGYLKGSLNIPKSTIDRTEIIKRKLEQKSKRTSKKPKPKQVTQNLSSIRKINPPSPNGVAKRSESPGSSSDIDMEPELMALAQNLAAESEDLGFETVDNSNNTILNKHSLAPQKVGQKNEFLKGRMKNKSCSYPEELPFNNTAPTTPGKPSKSISKSPGLLPSKNRKPETAFQKGEPTIKPTATSSNLLANTKSSNNAEKKLTTTTVVAKTRPYGIDLKKFDSLAKRVDAANNSPKLNDSSKLAALKKPIDTFDSTQIPRSKPKTLGRHVKVVKTPIKSESVAHQSPINPVISLRKSPLFISRNREIPAAPMSVLDRSIELLNKPYQGATAIKKTISTPPIQPSSTNSRADLPTSIPKEKVASNTTQRQPEAYTEAKQDLIATIGSNNISDLSTPKAQLDFNKNANSNPKTLVCHQISPADIGHLKGNSSNKSIVERAIPARDELEGEEDGEIFENSRNHSLATPDITKNIHKSDIVQSFYKDNPSLLQTETCSLSKNNNTRAQLTKITSVSNASTDNKNGTLAKNQHYSPEEGEDPEDDSYEDNMAGTNDANGTVWQNSGNQRSINNASKNFGFEQVKPLPSFDSQEHKSESHSLNRAAPNDVLYSKETYQPEGYHSFNSKNPNLGPNFAEQPRQETSKPRSMRLLNFQKSSPLKSDTLNANLISSSQSKRDSNSTMDIPSTFIELTNMGLHTPSLGISPNTSYETAESFILNIFDQNSITSSDITSSESQDPLDCLGKSFDFLTFSYDDQISHIENLNAEYRHLYSNLEKIQKDRFEALSQFVSDWNKSYYQFQSEVKQLSEYGHKALKNNRLSARENECFYDQLKNFKTESLVRINRSGSFFEENWNSLLDSSTFLDFQSLLASSRPEDNNSSFTPFKLNFFENRSYEHLVLYIVKDPEGPVYLCGYENSSLLNSSPGSVDRNMTPNPNHSNKRSRPDGNGINDSDRTLVQRNINRPLAQFDNRSPNEQNSFFSKVKLPVVYRVLLSAEVELWALFTSFVQISKKLWSTQTRDDTKRLSQLQIEISLINKAISQ